MGTTLTALKGGSLTAKFVVAIEGVPYLITDGVPSAAVTAWGGTHWTQALSGMAVELNNESSLDPWAPFSPGGSCTLSVQPDSLGDVIGVMVARSSGGTKTVLKVSLDRDDNVITVGSTTGFAASGEAYVGNECFSYTGITATTFTGVARGRYSPFSSATPGVFAHAHKVGDDANQVTIEPTVSQFPRTWTGRWAGVWIHRDIGGVLDLKAEAQLVFAGRIAEVRDDQETGATVFSLEHLLDYVKDGALYRDPWKASVTSGVYLRSGDLVDWGDHNGTTPRAANDLIVKVGAVLDNEIEEGWYSLDDIVDKINRWLDSELNASRLHYRYVVRPFVDGHSEVGWYVNSGSSLRAWSGAFSDSFAKILGLVDVVSSGALKIISDSTQSTGFKYYASEFAPLASLPFSENTSAYLRVPIENIEGVFLEQSSSLPFSAGISSALLSLFPDRWFVFLLDGVYCVGRLDLSNSFIDYVRPISLTGPSGSLNTLRGIPYGSPKNLTVQQVFALEKSFSDLVLNMLTSSGVVAYNGASDIGLDGLGVPQELLGTEFTNSLVGLGGSSSPALVLLDKPLKFSDLFGADFMLRRASLIWKNQRLRITTWGTPIASLATHTLDETNKAEPSGNTVTQRSPSTISTQWLRNLVKIEFNRDPVKNTYNNYVSLADQTSIDDHSGQPSVITISTPNYYTSDPSSDPLLIQFLSALPFFSRPVRLISRSVDLRKFEDIAAGDVVTVTDSFARDPITGLRGVIARPGILVSHKASYGGLPHGGGGVLDMVGEVVIAVSETDRSELYSPSGETDESANTGGFTSGYNSGTNTLRLRSHSYSEGSDISDAARFLNGQKIRITEIDPADPASPTTWARTVSNSSGNDLTLTAALSSPAFDITKIYRITSDLYANAVTLQKSDAYQALSATHKIQATVDAKTYITASFSGTFTPASNADLGEIIPINSYGDGAPLDSGNDYALAVTANWLLDSHCAPCSPMLSPTEISFTSGTGTRKTLAVFPFWVGRGETQNATDRLARVSVWVRTTDGTRADFRVSVLRTLPTTDDILDVVRPLPYSEINFSVASATYARSTPQTISLKPILETGQGFLLIESTIKGSTLGLCKFEVLPR